MLSFPVFDWEWDREEKTSGCLSAHTSMSRQIYWTEYARNKVNAISKMSLSSQRNLDASIPHRWGCGFCKKQTVCKYHPPNLENIGGASQNLIFHSWGVNQACADYNPLDTPWVISDVKIGKKMLLAYDDTPLDTTVAEGQLKTNKLVHWAICCCHGCLKILCSQAWISNGASGADASISPTQWQLGLFAFRNISLRQISFRICGHLGETKMVRKAQEYTVLKVICNPY